MRNLKGKVDKVLKIISACLTTNTRKFRRKILKFTSEVLAFRLLRRANISRNEQVLILSGIDFDHRFTSYDQAKIALTQFRDCLETTSDGMSDIKL